VILFQTSDLLVIVLVPLLRVLYTLNEALDTFWCALSLPRLKTLALAYLEFLIHLHFGSVQLRGILEQHFVLLDTNVCRLCYLINELLSSLLLTCRLFIG
jgi:hypothetical protein